MFNINQETLAKAGAPLPDGSEDRRVGWQIGPVGDLASGQNNNRR